MVNFLILITGLVFGFFFFRKKVISLVGNHLEKSYPAYRTYPPEEKKKMAFVASTLMQHSVMPRAGTSSQDMKKATAILADFSWEQQNIVERARLEVRKYFYFFPLYIVFLLAVMITLDQLNILPII
jgi:hypothetical protein